MLESFNFKLRINFRFFLYNNLIFLLFTIYQTPQAHSKATESELLIFQNRYQKSIHAFNKACEVIKSSDSCNNYLSGKRGSARSVCKELREGNQFYIAISEKDKNCRKAADANNYNSAYKHWLGFSNIWDKKFFKIPPRTLALCEGAFSKNISDEDLINIMHHEIGHFADFDSKRRHNSLDRCSTIKYQSEIFGSCKSKSYYPLSNQGCKTK